MTGNDIRNLLQRHPFEPFRVITADGTTYDVRHPDLVMVGLSSVIIGVPAETDPYFFSRTHIVSLRHILRLEPEEQEAESQGQ